MDQLTKLLTQMDSIVLWIPVLVLLMETGICLTICLGLIQLFKLPISMRFFFGKNEEEHNIEGDVTSFAGLCTSLDVNISRSYDLEQY